MKTMSEKIEAGTYRAHGVEGSAQTGMTKNGNEQVAINLDLVDLGRNVTTFLPFTDAAAPYSIERLHALGWKGGEDPSFPGISENEVQVQIKYETYQGKEQMKVDIVTGNGRVSLKDPMNDVQRRGFMSRLAKLVKQSGTAAPAATTNTKKMSL
jgi:hypothetical protein